MSTIFEKIIKREIPADIVFEDDEIIAFKDIKPAAPVHLLLVPKKVIKDLQSLEKEDLHLMGKITALAQQLAKELGLDDGYRLLVNNGKNAGQEVFHLHFHLLGGKRLGPIA